MKQTKVRSLHHDRPRSSSQVGIAWYRPEQWARLREISEDRDELEKTWEEWRRDVDKAMLGLIKQGIVPERVDVDVEELLDWCVAQNQRVNGGMRAQYAAAKLAERHEGQTQSLEADDEGQAGASDGHPL